MFQFYGELYVKCDLNIEEKKKIKRKNVQRTWKYIVIRDNLD